MVHLILIAPLLNGGVIQIPATVSKTIQVRLPLIETSSRQTKKSGN